MSSTLGVERGGRALVAHLPRVPFTWVGPAILFIEAAAILSISVATGLAYHWFALGDLGDIDTFIGVGASTFVYCAIVFAYRGNYSIANISSVKKQLAELTVTWWFVALFQFAVVFLLKIGPNFSRGATSAFFIGGWLFLLLWRWVLARYAAGAIAAGLVSARRIIVLGEPELMAGVGFLPNLARIGYRATKVLSLGETSIEDIQRATQDDPTISGILLVMDWKSADRINEITIELGVVPLPVLLLPDAHTAAFLDRPLVRFGEVWTPELQRGPLTISERVCKRIMDLLVAVPVGLLSLPILLIAAVLIRLESPGPVLFTQARGGFNGRKFRIFKLRTLKVVEDGAAYKQVLRNDQRMTRIGHLLRRTCVDELPQMLNVIRGEMSLVGPRPHPVALNEQYQPLIDDYSFRHHVKPGLTGWAQVNGFRGENSVALMQKRVEFDRWYIDHWSLWLDFKIILRTLLLIVRQDDSAEAPPLAPEIAPCDSDRRQRDIGLQPSVKFDARGADGARS